MAMLSSYLFFFEINRIRKQQSEEKIKMKSLKI